MAFVERLISIKFTLDQGSFADSGKNQLTIGPANLRITTKIVKAGGASMPQLQAAVYGMTKSQMNQLSTLGMRVNVNPRNTVSVMAGDAESGMSLVFEGGITQGFADLNSLPDVPFRVCAISGIVQALDAPQPTSYKGGVDAAVVLKQLATQAGLSFENSTNVSAQVSNCYLPGSTKSQIERICETAGFGYVIDQGTLSIWKKNGTRKTTVVDINVNTGMVGSPSYTAQGIMVRTLYNPAVKFMGQVQVESQFIPKSQWTVYTLEYDLDAHMPHGNWQQTLGCYNASYPAPVTR